MRHGEYKTPGGKLVAVNVAVDEDGTIKSCNISGDFFIESDTDAESHALLHDLEQVLVNSGSVRLVLGAHPSCRIIGTDVDAIETAYARAIGSSESAVSGRAAVAELVDKHGDEYQARWAALKPQLTVIHDHPRTPSEQMAIDETWAREVASGHRPPTIRFWEWAGPAVVIGKFQSASDEVHLDVAEQLGFSVVRRCTGGGAMFIEPGNTITYSLYAPLDFVSGVSIEESYRLCDWWLVEALRELGLDVRFAGLNDIASQYGKIGGAAQRRFPAVHTADNSGETDVPADAGKNGAFGRLANVSKATTVGSGAVLHHVTMAYDIDAAKMGHVLNTSREKMSDKAVKSAVKRVDPMKSQTGLTREQIVKHLLGWFAD